MEYTQGKIDTVDYAGHIAIQLATSFYSGNDLLEADDVGHERAIANGNRIVKTWNAHDALVKIAKARLQSLSKLKNQSTSQIHELRSIKSLLKTLEE